MTDSAEGLEIENLKVKGNTHQLSGEFQEVEYIEKATNDNVYLDFGMPFSRNTRIQIKYLQIETVGSIIIGTGTSTNEMRFFGTNGSFYVDVKNSSNRLVIANENLLNTIHEIEVGNHYIKDLTTNEYIGQRNALSEDSFTKTDSNIRTVDGKGVKMYYVKIYEGNILVRDCIPCYQKSNNEVGMYDLVNGVFYINQGAGNFVKGNDVENSFSIPSIEYSSKIESVIGTNEINVTGGNLFDANKNFPFTQNGLTFSKNEDGSIVINGTCTVNTHFSLSTGYSQEKQNAMSGKTYALQIETTGVGTWGDFGLKHNGSSGRLLLLTQVSGEGIFRKVGTYTRQGFDTGLLYWAGVIAKDTVFKNYTMYVSCVEGTECKKYMKHEEKTIIMPLQKEMYAQDYLSEDGEYHLMKRLVLDGTENWTINGKETGYENNPQTFSLSNIVDMKSINLNDVQKNVLSTWSVCGRYPLRQIINGLHYGIECGGKRICICLEKFNNFTLDEFKTYLAEQYENGTPLEIVYELENEEVLPYTEEQQEAYKQLKELKTYKEITHIDSVTDNLSPILSFCYRKDLQIENDRIKARLDEIEALLSTTGTSALLLNNLENDLKSEVM